MIGLEFATVYTRLGAKVLVVEALPQHPDRHRPRNLQDARPHPQETGRRDRALHEGRNRSKRSATTKSRRRSTASTPSGKPETREFDTVLVAVGRRPVTDGLNLEAAGLKTDEKGFIAVDAQRQHGGRRHLRDRRHHRRSAARAQGDEGRRRRRRSDRGRPSRRRSIRSRSRTASTPIPKSRPSGSPRKKPRPPATRSRSASSRWWRAAARAR